MPSIDYALIGRFTRDKLQQRGTYWVALLVGTFINGYGHLLVPYLRGQKGVVTTFAEAFEATPVLVSLSILLAYCFPVCVGVYSSVATRYLNRAHESRSRFPDCKPDPVFRAATDGTIVDAGERTMAVFREHRIGKAQEVLGETLWDELVARQIAGDALPHETRVHVPAYDQWYYVGHSDCGDGGVNVYLTMANAPA